MWINLSCVLLFIPLTSTTIDASAALTTDGISTIKFDILFSEHLATIFVLEIRSLCSRSTY